jgi:DNA polymerase-3 subunit delta'
VAKKASTSSAPPGKSKAKAPRIIDRTDEKGPAPIPVPIPVPLESIIGQDWAIGLLRDAMRSERMHHAWIFHGPQGVGKFTTAVAFASILLDPTSEPGLDGTIAPDPESRTQQLLRAGTHPDLHIVVKELARFHEDPEVRKKKLRNIPVEVLRQYLIEPAKRSASLTHQSRASSVFIVDEADLMDPKSGQNSVLKTLEEPPAGMVIILVTSNESFLIPTIRSRCQRVPFAQLSDANLRKWISTAKIEIPADSRDFLISFADGSPGSLLSALRGNIPEWRKAILPHLSKMLTGRYSVGAAPLMEQLCGEWADNWVDENDNASKELANHMAAGWMIRLIAHELRRTLRTGNPAAADAIDAVHNAERQLESNLKPLFVFDVLSAEIAQHFAG